MINPIQAEANKSATYVDNYLDSVENLPEDVQRCLSRIRDIDSRYRTHLRDVDHYYDVWKALQNDQHAAPTRISRAIALMHQSLVAAQEQGDEKMQVVAHLQEMIEQKTRQLDMDQKKLDIREEYAQQQRLEQLQQAEDNYGATGSKLGRTQSPVRGCSEQNLNGMALGLAERYAASGLGSLAVGNSKELTAAALQAFANVSNNGIAAGGSSTPNSERSVCLGNGAAAASSAASNGSHSASGETQRANAKRPRRRHDTGNGSLELCGNESNSANEFAVGNERQQQKTGTLGGSNKKHGNAQAANVAAGATSAAGSAAANTSGGSSSGGAAAAAATGGSGTGKKKKRKTRGVHAGGAAAQVNAREETPPPDQIDPDEPTYCICNQISYGEMILCDNDLCPIEWFHFSCVSLVLKPKGKWFCPKCRGDRSNVMKPKAQFLKELERYNKEKEEKT